jgi:putative membrane protein
MKKIIISTGIFLTSLTLQAQTGSPDTDFATEAAQAGMLEVKLGQLAMDKSSSSDVKELGRMMVDDHTKANDELKSIAAKKNITLPATLDNKGQKHYDELSKKSGAEFDKAYTKLMVKDHKKVVADFKKEAANGKDPDLKSWAAKTAPKLEHHLSMSETTEQKVGNGNNASANKK